MTRLSLNLKATEIVPRRILYGFWGVLLLAGVSLHAQQTPQNLEKLARNPVGDTVKIPLAESINFDAGPYGRASNSLQIQPTIPFLIAEEWLLIPRIVATLAAYEPEVSQASGGSIGLGDTVGTLFLTPAHTGMVVWGVGPSVLIPTATDTNTGAGKMGLGCFTGLCRTAKLGIDCDSGAEYLVPPRKFAANAGEPIANRDLRLL